MFYVSLALSDTMFPDHEVLNPQRTKLTAQEVKEHLHIWGNGVVSALNMSHQGTIQAIKERFGIDLPTNSGKTPQIQLSEGDYLLVCQAKFSHRLAEGERYSQEEIDQAGISFSLWTF